MSNECLPEELVVEILSRLPVKSLKRFRCVCRSWLSLIENPDFIKNHYRSNALTGSHINAIVKGSHESHETDCSKVARFSFLCNKTMVVRDSIENPYWDVVGECEGLILLFCGLMLAIMNLATKDFKVIPEASRTRPHSYLNSLGFGYDEKSNDYKVIRFVNAYKTARGDPIEPISFHSELYSLNSNSWKDIHHPYGLGPFFYHQTRFQTYVNGSCHWFDDHGAESIIAFDMSDETFHTVGFPFGDKFCMDFGWGQELRVHDDCLAVFESSKDNIDCYQLWVMKDYGVEESWTKHLLIGPIHDLKDLFCMWKTTGEWFYRNTDNKLALYNPHSNVVRDLQIHNRDDDMALLVVIFNESLYSLNGSFIESYLW